MSVAHTPGPWKRHGLNVRSPYGCWICTLLDVWSDARTPKNQKMANARLIAAAPDLLAALEAALTAVEYYHEHEGCDAMLDQARAAIAKAQIEY